MGESLTPDPFPRSVPAAQDPAWDRFDTGAETVPGAGALVERYTNATPATVPQPGSTKPAPIRPSPALGGAFARAHAIVATHEGGFQADPRDPGNWSGGGIGKGECRGTNWGISARAYPDVDIRALTREQAAALYKRDYWDKVRGDDLPPALALLVYDAAVNCGPGRAARWLQQALGATQDGVIGPLTLGAVERFAGRGADLCAEYMKLRWLFHIGLPTWRTFGRGWAARLSALPFQSMQMEDTT